MQNNYSYEESYIFVSYSHKDRNTVRPLISTLTDEGYRIWYDEDIIAGDTWSEILASKITNCCVFMPIISQSYCESFRCEQEIMYADSEKKKILPVRLDDSPISEHIRFLLKNSHFLSLIQRASSNNYFGFFSKINSIPFLLPCRISGKNDEYNRKTITRCIPEIVTTDSPVAPSRFFLGREDELKKIDNAVKSESVVVSGMGGIGKSEICRKLFHNYITGETDTHFKYIGWVTWKGTTKESFYKQFIDIEGEDLEEYSTRCFSLINRLGFELLLFIDNADSMSEKDAADISRFRCRFIITSRKKFDILNTLEIGRLSLECCRRLYLRTARLSSTNFQVASYDVLDEILRLASYHTLTIELLAKTQLAADFIPEQLLSKLRDSGFDLSEVQEEISYIHNPEQPITDDIELTFVEHMSRIFDLSGFNDIEAGKGSLLVLQGMSLLTPNVPIPVQKVREWFELKNLNGLNKCVDNGWLIDRTDLGPRNISIHPVIASVVHHSAMPHNDYINTIAHNLYKSMIVSSNDDFTLNLPVLQHAISLEHIVGRLSSIPYSQMLYQMGHLLIERADYNRALRYLHCAADIQTEVLGSEHPDTATTFNDIGISYNNLGDYDQALEWLQKALTVREKVLGPEHIDTAQTYNDLGLFCWANGDNKLALEWYKKSLNIRKKVLGPNHPLTAKSYNNIGFLHWESSQYEYALDLHEKALRIKVNTLGVNHPSTARSYNNIGNVYKMKGDSKKALEMFYKALSIRETLLGTNHPDTATTYTNIGTVFYALEEYSEALQYFNKGYNIFLNVLGDNHLWTKRAKKWIDDTLARL